MLNPDITLAGALRAGDVIEYDGVRSTVLGATYQGSGRLRAHMLVVTDNGEWYIPATNFVRVVPPQARLDSPTFPV